MIGINYKNLGSQGMRTWTSKTIDNHLSAITAKVSKRQRESSVHGTPLFPLEFSVVWNLKLPKNHIGS